MEIVEIGYEESAYEIAVDEPEIRPTKTEG